MIIDNYTKQSDTIYKVKGIYMQSHNIESLADLFTKYGSDKTTNGYAGLYECLFHHMRYQNIKFLEIGIGTMIPGMISSMHGYAPDTYKPGASLRAWRDYFENSMIYGLDIQPDTQFEENRIKTIQTDSRNPELTNELLDNLNLSMFDVIIDDGSHKLSDQLATLDVMLGKVKPGGTYIIEDVGGIDADEFMSIIKNKAGNMPMFMLGPKNNICVIVNSLKVESEPKINFNEEYNLSRLNAVPNLPMLVKSGDWASNPIIRYGVWEPEITEKIVSISNDPGGMLVDVGANMGYFSLIWAASNPNNKVFSIEPSLRNIEILKKNLEMNNLTNQVTIMPVAAGAKTQLSNFMTGPTNETGHGGFSNSTDVTNTIQVLTIKLDDYFDHIDVLKIDVEGADALVLMGASRLLQEKKINKIFYEINIERANLLGIKPTTATELLAAYGYTSHLIKNYPGGADFIATLP